MTEPLPLIPNKKGEVVGDARPLLHAVFRDIIPPTLPLPAPPQHSGACNTPNELASTSWIKKNQREKREQIDHEDELKDSFAKKLCRKYLFNEYKITHYHRPESQGTWRLEKGLISRRDLKPTIVENAAGDSILWVRNCLADDSSTCDNICTCIKVQHQKQISLEAHDKDTSYQSISVVPALKPRKLLLVAKPANPPDPQYITCIPDDVEFVNFVIGQCYKVTIRIVNMSKFDLRLSLKPPSRREFHIEIISKRGLTVSAGAAAKIKVRFRPTHVRMIEDELTVRANKGKSVNVKIKCYMRPPKLELLLGIPDILQYVKDEVDSMICMEYLDLGAKLLGDVHNIPLTFYSRSDHARFFIMTEDDWNNYIVNENASVGFLSCDGFTVRPVYIEGGGWIQGSIWFHSPNAGLHCLELKIISSTAAIRSINLIADSIMFHPTNITIQAHEKDFNICGDDDPGCMYYLNLGEAFPGRSVQSTLKLINNSSVSYSYCWKSRPWCICSCYRDCDGDSEHSDCIGEKMMSEGFELHPLLGDEKQAEIFPPEGILGPQETIDVSVTANTTGCGIHRIVFMLILNNVPEESIPSSFKPDTIEAKIIESESIPGTEPCKRTVHSFVLCQLEVWWKTVPLHFVMIPPALNIQHSLTVSNVMVELCACQTTGSEEIQTRLRDNGSELRAELALPAARAPHAARISLVQPLRTKRTEDAAVLEALSGEWQASTRVTTVPVPRTPHFYPSSAFQLLAYPGSMLTFEFILKNNTYGPISWRAVSMPWKDTEVSARCMLAPCPVCYDRTCRCDALRPASGHLMHGEKAEIVFRFSAPKTDGVYANLLSIRFTRLQGLEDYKNQAENLRNIEEPRQFPASLVAYRVMTPVVILRIKPCLSNCRHFSDFKCNRDCQLDEGAHGSPNGTAVLRPKHIIYLGQRTCYTLTVTNITPVPTKLTWDNDDYSEDCFTVVFVPNEVEIGSYAEVVTQVLVEGTGVCARRVSVRTATLEHSPMPVYLTIDAAVAGLEVIVEIPLGGPTSGYATLKLIQKEKSVRKKDHKMTSNEMFAENDRKKEINRANICNCKKEWVYIPPKVVLGPPRDPDELSLDHYTPPEIVTKPPLTLICGCLSENRPFTPTEPEPLCLQFRSVPLHTECKQRLFLRNISPVTANWVSQIRRWPLSKTVTLKYEDRWKKHLSEVGLGIAVSPCGILLPYTNTYIDITVFGDTWGVYHDELLIQIEELKPIIVDIWIEIVGLPLSFVFEQKNGFEDAIPQLCISRNDTTRTVRATNQSRTDLLIRAYLTTEHENPRDVMPFRVYIKFYDVEPSWCPCVNASTRSDSFGYSRSTSETSLEMNTGIDLYISPDYGNQNNQHYQVEPLETLVETGKQVMWKVTMNEIDEREPIPNYILVLRMEPVVTIGSYYARPPLPPRALRVIATPRHSKLEISCCRLTVRLNALELLTDNVLRVRKYTTMRNVGTAPLSVTANVESPWRVRTEQPINMPAKSTMELIVEVEIEPPMTLYAPVPKDENISRDVMKFSCTKLILTDRHRVMASLPLELRVEYPLLLVEPESINFHYVKIGDFRKTYFTVWHSSSTETIEAVVTKIVDEITVHPTELIITPGSHVRVYVMYESRLSLPILDTVIRVVSKPERDWCTAQVRIEAETARDYRCRVPVHDNTDDTVLLGKLSWMQ